MQIHNPDDIRQFRSNSKLHNDIVRVCKKYKMNPKIQVFSAQEKQDYRGLTLGNTITLHWSNLETPKSMLWVFCHELRHFIIARKPDVFAQLENVEIEIAEKLTKRKIDKMSVRTAHRALYDIGITEAICDLFATEEIGKDYGMNWYSRRMKNKARREKWQK